MSIDKDRLAAVTEKRRLLVALSDGDFSGRIREARSNIDSRDDRRAHEADVFALVCEAARRTVGMDPFDVQVVAGLALADGRVAELGTGEGKTLAAVAPACLAALTGSRVHILTFNDYLASRDAAWMRPIYTSLGLSVGLVQESSTRADRKKAYAADITYVTATEAGFDFLRDNLARDPHDLLQPALEHAIVDEADSIVIDEARVPLVIAGRAEDPPADRRTVSSIVANLTDQHWRSDNDDRNVYLTDAGIDEVEASLRRVLGRNVELHARENLELLTEVNQALHARVLLRRDVDYIVRGGRVELVDEFTGRVVRDRRWPDGLQAALESKEGLAIQPGGRILGTITMQHFLLQYEFLAGMTATAESASAELEATYRLKVVPIPPNRPDRRIDRDDLVFATDSARDGALVSRIRTEHLRRRPVLVGTASVAQSERIGRLLENTGISCAILNAANDALEAEIIAGAGAPGAVTISTNMAGRGTDIRLGGADEADHASVVSAGGLLVLGTHRHESRRIDLQLRGRAGRQGDPGESQFYVSLEDPLMRRLGIDRLIPRRLRVDFANRPLDHRVVRREVARLQRIAEGQAREIRSTLRRYSHPIEQQLGVMRARRKELLSGECRSVDVLGLSAGVEAHYEALVAETGLLETTRAIRLIAVAVLDEAWASHLADIAHLREGIHLVGIAGLDPLFEFRKQVGASFEMLLDDVTPRTAELFMRLRARQGRIDLESAGVTAPTSTWTYLLNDRVASDLHQMLFSPGHVGLAAGAAVMVWPLLAIWGVWMRLRGNSTRS